MKTIKWIFPIAFLSIAMVFTACNDESSRSLVRGDVDVTEAEGELMAEDMESCNKGERLPMMHMLKFRECGDWKEKLPDCATVTESGESFPKTITIDFGEGCEGEHGKQRSGKVIITFSDDIKEEGAVKTVTYENHFIGNRQLEGAKTLTNIGKNDDGNYVFDLSASTKIISERGTMTKNRTGQIEWIEGIDTDDCYDDKLKITGSSTTTSDRGERTRSIIEPIVIDPDCKYITQGIVKITGKNGELTIDFGNGDCDNTALVTKDGVETEIDLDKHRERKHKRKCQGKK